MISASLGEKFVAALIAGSDAAEFVSLAATAEKLMATDAEVELFGRVRDFVSKYGTLPKAETAKVEWGFEVVAEEKAAKFYFDKLVDRLIAKRLTDTTKEAAELMKPLTKDPRLALKKYQEAVFELLMLENSNSIYDFRDAADMILPALNAKLKDYLPKIDMGWPSLDQVSGGLNRGDLISFVGRPATGKTWFSVWTALAIWNQMKTVVFVSMEMIPQLIIERLAAVETGTMISCVSGNNNMPQDMDKFGMALKNLKKHQNPLYVIDGNMSATVQQIEMICKQLQPDAIVIDGAYLLEHENPRLGRYEKVAVNCDLIKKRLCAIAPTIASWQFNREAAKKKKDTDAVGMEDIADSDTIPRHSSVVLGLFQDDGSVETLKHRKIRVMKGRQGEAGEFQVKWDFIKMDFSEYDPESTLKSKKLENL